MNKNLRKVPKKISKRYLENAALFYLQRYSSSAGNLRRILQRKIDRSCQHHEVDAVEFVPVLDEIIVRYTENGLLDDAVYARGKVATLRKQGKSRQMIHSKLYVKGLGQAHIDAALEEIDAETGHDAELQAAMLYARKKRLGAFRRAPIEDPKNLQKELANLARGGFSYEIARRVLDYCPDEDEGLFI